MPQFMQLSSFFTSYSSADYWLAKLLSIPGMVLFFSFRGFFQAWVAKKLGDHLPEQRGFLTMNPKAHLDPLGFVMLVLVGFGFGKPMQFDGRFYKHPKRDGAIQILSAPAAGIILAFAEYAVYYILLLIGFFAGILNNQIYMIILWIFEYAYLISLTLTVFLFLPLPGFDSYRLIVNFLPYSAYRKLYAVEKYSMWIFIGFIVLLRVPVIGDFLSRYLIDIPTAALAWLIKLPFDLISSLISM
ncbi:MAG: site-2 protease family protein [Clostridia bacterium]|nr:site-2 protease family protein [Clostridia bacterium]